MKGKAVSGLILALLLMGILPLSFRIQPVEASETTIFEDDFESYSIGTFPSAGGWELWTDGAGSEHQVIVDSFSNSPTKSLQLLGRNHWSAFAAHPYSTTQRFLSYEVCVRVNELATQYDIARVGFVDWYSYPTTPRFFSAVGFRFNGSIRLAGYGELQTFVLGEWYKVKQVTDRVDDTSSVWINDVLKASNVPVTDSGPPRPDVHFNDTIAFAVASLWPGVEAYFDDAKLSEKSGASSDWWDYSWGYRKSHVIQNAIGTGTDYQVKIRTEYGIGVDNGDTVYLNNHAQVDFDDVRFLDDDQSTELDYWLEEKVDGDYAVFWVEIQDDLSSSDQTIYVYCGNDGASYSDALQHGKDTFLLFDDFEDASLDAQWTKTEYATLPITETGGYLEFRNQDAFQNDYRESYVTGSFTEDNIAVKTEMQYEMYDYSDLYHFCGTVGTYGSGPANPKAEMQYRDWLSSEQIHRRVRTDDSMTKYEYLGVVSSVQQVFEYRKNGSTVKYYFDDELFKSDTITSGIDFAYLRLWFYGDNDVNYEVQRWIRFYYVIVRKYTDPEPTHGIWGNEETNPYAIIILSPQSRHYATTSVPLTFIVNETASWMGYSLDGQANVTVTGNTTLTGLLEGSHNVVVYANNTAGTMWASRTVYFTVDLTPPTVSVLSPENTTYTSASVPLTFTVDEPTSWIGYSLNDEANVTISGNTALNIQTNGSHSIIVYAKDMAGNTAASNRVFFTVELPISGSCTISIEPSKTVVALSQTVTVTITITNINDCAGYQLYIDYNAAVLEYVGYTFDTDPSNPLSPTQMAPASADRVDLDVSVSGSVKLVTVWKAATPTYSGSGVAAEITFQALAAGNSTLKFDQVWTKAVDYDGDDILFEEFNDNFIAVVVAMQSISVDSSKEIVQSGQTITVTVNITDITDCAGYQFKIDYNPAILALDSWTFDTGTPLTPSQMAPAAAQRLDTQVSVPGSVRLATVWRAGVPSYSGSGVAAEVTFQTLTAGNSTLVFDQYWTIAVDSVGEEVIFGGFDDGWVVVTVQGDVDSDHDVDVADQRKVQLAMFSTYPEPLYIQYNTHPIFTDVDGDLDVDVGDQRIQQNHMFESW